MNLSSSLAEVFNIDRARRAVPAPARISLTDAMARIEHCSRWLADRNLRILTFTGTTLHDPVIVVAAHPDVWSLFCGRAERTGYKQDGALRYEVWEGLDRINHVRVRWQKVMACA